MRQYVIDELRYEDYTKLKDYLGTEFGASSFGGIYWVPLDQDLLTSEQKSHTECQPYYVAVDLSETALSCELLVRTRKKLRCDCMAYANENQRNWIVNFIDSVFEKNNLLF